MSLEAARRLFDPRRGQAVLHSVRSAILDTIYPPRCLACPQPTDAPHGLCAACWRDTHFITGAACFRCGVPVTGAAGADALCDGCMRHPPAWDRGAAAAVYGGAARRAVLAFKHGDRLDMGGALAGWMAAAGHDLLETAEIIAPVPLHWRRLLKRRYNQSAELARHLGRRSGKRVMVDLITRQRATTPQEKMNAAARAANQAGAFAVRPQRASEVAGRSVLLVDDVLTTGATLSACAEAVRSAGADRVGVLVLARVAFGDAAGL